MTDLLLIGDATERMIKNMSARFTIHDAFKMAGLAGFLSENGAKIEAVATNGHDGIKPEIMNALPSLKIISCYGVGYDAINAVEAARRGVVVTHTPDVLNNDVANTAIMLMLAVSRRLIRDDAWIRSGNWEERGNAPLTSSIEGKKVGIVGLGRIGETIAKKLTAGFDCEISYHSRNKKSGFPYAYFPDLKQMACEVDYLVVITPGGPDTDKLVGREIMDALGPKGTLINISRGSVVDEAEMVSALEEGRLGNAGLDVFEKEPNVPAALLDMENVVLTPHVGSATVETRRAMGDLTVSNLLQFFDDGTVISPVPECRDIAKIRSI